MPKEYNGLGLSFLFPDSWELGEDADALSMTLESPEGAFLTVSRCDGNADSAFKQAVSVMEEEYDEIETEVISRTFVEHELTGIVQRFIYLDLIVTSQLLRLEAGSTSYLIQIQAEDQQMEAYQLVFDAILTSLCQSLGKASTAQ